MICSTIFGHMIYDQPQGTKTYYDYKYMTCQKYLNNKFYHLQYECRLKNDSLNKSFFNIKV